MTAGSRDLEGLSALALGLDVDELTRLHTERRAVDELSVDEDVAMHDHLARLRRGAGEACADDEGVQTHLELLDEVLTGQTLGAACLVELDAQLLLADAVLLAKALLLAQTDGVVAVGLALGAAVLTGSVRTLLEVTGGLRRQRDTERAGQADLAAVLGLRSHEVILSMTRPWRSRLADVSLDPAFQDARRGDPEVVEGGGDARKLGFEPVQSSRGAVLAEPRGAAKGPQRSPLRIRRILSSRACRSRSAPSAFGS